MKKDNRCKLTQEQKAEIIALPLKQGRFNGASEIAKKYGVSKRTIQFILDPKKLEDNRILAKERKKLKISSLELG
jgi:transposase-like protein